MGRIKTALTKRITFKLLEKNRDNFSTDYDQNKEAIEKATNITSKKLRNIIAGYVTRLVRHSENSKEL